MSLNLDKRIRSLQNIQTVFLGCKDWLFMGKMGYFADNLEEFRDLTKCVYGEYMGFAEKDKCFTAEVRGNATQFEFRYFIPEDVLLPEEPKKIYKPYSNELWTRYFDIGDVIHFRRKDNAIVHHMMFTGYSTEDGTDMTAYGIGAIILGGNQYSFQTLFESYEIKIDDNWQPFGILEEE